MKINPRVKKTSRKSVNTKTRKQSTGKKTKKSILGKIRSIHKSSRVFGIYVIIDGHVKFIRYRSYQKSDSTISYDIDLVDKFSECTKFINADSAKIHVESIMKTRKFDDMKIIEQSKLDRL